MLDLVIFALAIGIVPLVAGILLDLTARAPRTLA